MDETHQSPNLKSLKHFIRYHQKTTKFLLSVSVFFSIFFSNSTFHSNLSTLLVKLMTHTIDKNFMFLFCNGLLVLLAKYSTSTTTTTTTTNSPSKQNVMSNDDYFLKRSYEYVPKMRSQIISSVRREDEVSIVPQEKVVQEDRKDEEEEQEQEQEEAEVILYETSTAEEEEEVFGDEEEQQVVVEEEATEEEEGEEEKEVSGALLSTEELNKKFDEFIRKMKEELRIEARQHQLIMV